MKTFACGDVIPGCGATWSAADDDGIFFQAGKHAHEAHGVTAPTPELTGQIRAAIRTV
jgi:predicted small metal-binding protein